MSNTLVMLKTKGNPIVTLSRNYGSVDDRWVGGDSVTPPHGESGVCAENTGVVVATPKKGGRAEDKAGGANSVTPPRTGGAVGSHCNVQKT